MPLQVNQNSSAPSTSSPDGTAAFPLQTSGVAAAITAVATGQITVATTATQIVAERVGRAGVIIVNHGAADVFLGPAGVATTTGMLLLGTAGSAASIDGAAAIFGIVAAGTQVVSFMEQF